MSPANAPRGRQTTKCDGLPHLFRAADDTNRVLAIQATAAAGAVSDIVRQREFQAHTDEA